MVKKKTPRKGIVTSHQRGREAVQEAKIKNVQKGNSEGVVLAEGQEFKVVQSPETEINEPSETLKDGLREKSRLAHEKAQELPEGVLRLFELTRDNQPTPKEYADYLISSGEISGDDVYNAIKFGFEAGPYNSISKER